MNEPLDSSRINHSGLHFTADTLPLLPENQINPNAVYYIDKSKYNFTFLNNTGKKYPHPFFLRAFTINSDDYIYYELIGYSNQAETYSNLETIAQNWSYNQLVSHIDNFQTRFRNTYLKYKNSIGMLEFAKEENRNFTFIIKSRFYFYCSPTVDKNLRDNYKLKELPLFPNYNFSDIPKDNTVIPLNPKITIPRSLLQNLNPPVSLSCLTGNSYNYIIPNIFPVESNEETAQVETFLSQNSTPNLQIPSNESEQISCLNNIEKPRFWCGIPIRSEQNGQIEENSHYSSEVVTEPTDLSNL